jgi:tetratricopeptide (TPR) repeat protein
MFGKDKIKDSSSTIVFNVDMDSMMDKHQQAKELYSKGIASEREGRIQEAIALFDKAISIFPEYLNAWIGKGGSFMIQQKFVEAIACFDQALKIRPQDPFSWYNKGVSLLKLGKRHEAIEALKKMIEFSGPEHANKVAEVKAIIYKLGQNI